MQVTAARGHRSVACPPASRPEPLTVTSRLRPGNGQVVEQGSEAAVRRKAPGLLSDPQGGSRGKARRVARGSAG